MQSAFSGGDPQHLLSVALADKINKAAGGRLILDPQMGGAIVPAAEEWDGLRTGSLDIAWTCTMYAKSLNNAGPILAAVSGGLTSIQRMFWFQFGGGLDLAREVFSPHGIHYLGYIALPPEDFAYTKSPLVTLDDVRKMKMRTAGDGGEIMARLGAATVFLPGGELYESMQRGVINSFEYGAPKEGYENGFHEVFKYLYQSPARAPSDENSVAVNTQSFNALPDDLKEIVQRMVLETTDDYYGPTIIGDAQALQKIIDYGDIVGPLPKVIEDAFLAEAEKFYDEQMQKNDELYRKIMQSQREFRKYSVLKGLSG
jgi:TRAP-type mannitol/chloroaromatic compound transport system substrate-binding protein